MPIWASPSYAWFRLSMPPPDGVATARMPSMLSFHSWQTVALIG